MHRSDTVGDIANAMIMSVPNLGINCVAVSFLAQIRQYKYVLNYMCCVHVLGNSQAKPEPTLGLHLLPWIPTTL